MRWYVAQTQPSREQRALLNLTRQDFTAYLPRWRKRRSHARKVDTVLAPLFPRYIFVALDLDNMSWRSVNGTFGISHLIANGERPAPVPRGVIEAIQSREDADGAIKPLLSPLRHGDPLRILDGAFSDCLSRFESMADNERVTVLLDLLGRSVRVTLPVHAVSPA